MRDKTDTIASTRGLGNDPPGVAALQRKLLAVERDLDAIQAKLRHLRAEGEKLVARHPAEASAVPARLSALDGEWDELRGALRRREEALEAASKLQGVLRDLAVLQGWVAQTAAAVATEDAPATLAEAEQLLSQHEALGEEMARYGGEYRGARAAGREATRGQTDAVLRQRLEALDAGWEELGRMWENRRQRLRQALAFQMFLRDAKQLEGILGKQVRRQGDATPGWRGDAVVVTPVTVMPPAGVRGGTRRRAWHGAGSRGRRQEAGGCGGRRGRRWRAAAGGGGRRGEVGGRGQPLR